MCCPPPPPYEEAIVFPGEPFTPEFDESAYETGDSYIYYTDEEYGDGPDYVGDAGGGIQTPEERCQAAGLTGTSCIDASQCSEQGNVTNLFQVQCY